MVVSHHRSAGYLIWVLWRSCPGSETRSQVSSTVSIITLLLVIFLLLDICDIDKVLFEVNLILFKDLSLCICKYVHASECHMSTDAVPSRLEDYHGVSVIGDCDLLEADAGRELNLVSLEDHQVLLHTEPSLQDIFKNFFYFY